MKKAVFLSFLVSTLFFSCKKESTTTNLSKTQMLAKTTWQIDELIQQSGNSQTSYKRGGTNNTGFDYSKVRYIFKTDGTATFTDPSNNTYPVNWSFAASDDTKMNIVINYPPATPLSYAFVSISENLFVYTVFYTSNGQQNIATVKYIPL